MKTRGRNMQFYEKIDYKHAQLLCINIFIPTAEILGSFDVRPAAEKFMVI
jgi:hypothetical protein